MSGRATRWQHSAVTLPASSLLFHRLLYCRCCVPTCTAILSVSGRRRTEAEYDTAASTHSTPSLPPPLSPPETRDARLCMARSAGGARMRRTRNRARLRSRAEVDPLSSLCSLPSLSRLIATRSTLDTPLAVMSAAPAEAASASAAAPAAPASASAAPAASPAPAAAAPGGDDADEAGGNDAVNPNRVKVKKW